MHVHKTYEVIFDEFHPEPVFFLRLLLTQTSPRLHFHALRPCDQDSLISGFPNQRM